MSDLSQEALLFKENAARLSGAGRFFNSSFQVSACTVIGCGPWSRPITVLPAAGKTGFMLGCVCVYLSLSRMYPYVTNCVCVCVCVCVCACACAQRSQPPHAGATYGWGCPWAFWWPPQWVWSSWSCCDAETRRRSLGESWKTVITATVCPSSQLVCPSSQLQSVLHHS